VRHVIACKGSISRLADRLPVWRSGLPRERQKQTKL
jgi:hypothetical protein